MSINVTVTADNCWLLMVLQYRERFESRIHQAENAVRVHYLLPKPGPVMLGSNGHVIRAPHNLR